MKPNIKQLNKKLLRSPVRKFTKYARHLIFPHFTFQQIPKSEKIIAKLFGWKTAKDPRWTSSYERIVSVNQRRAQTRKWIEKTEKRGKRPT